MWNVQDDVNNDSNNINNDSNNSNNDSNNINNDSNNINNVDNGRKETSSPELNNLYKITERCFLLFYDINID